MALEVQGVRITTAGVTVERKITALVPVRNPDGSPAGYIAHIIINPKAPNVTCAIRVWDDELVRKEAA